MYDAAQPVRRGGRMARSLSSRLRWTRGRGLRPGPPVCDHRTVRSFPLRVLGPYKEPRGFRLVVVQGSRRKSLKFASLEQAQQSQALLLSEAQRSGGHRIGDVLAEYEQAMVQERGRLPQTATESCQRLRRFLPVDAQLGDITPALAQQIYLQETKRNRPSGQPVAVATHHLMLTLAKAFFSFGVARGYLPASPFAAVRKLGRPKAGKPQLTADEARRFLDVALGRAGQGDVFALAAAMQLGLGLRSSELLLRQVRDVDEAGAVLRVPFGKTDRAARRLQVPDMLRSLLLSRGAGHDPAAKLFPHDGSLSAASTVLRRKVHEICQQAGVPPVCPHSLRGLHATLAIRQGVSGQAVAAALGHGSFAVTARHYADPSTLHAVQTQAVLASIAPSVPSPPSPPSPPSVPSVPSPPPVTSSELTTLVRELRQRLPKESVIELAALLLASLKE